MIYPRYEAYKDSGVEWLREIPEHWDKCPLFTLMQERDEQNTGNREQNVLSLSYGRIVRRNVDSNFGLLPESFETYQIVEPCNLILRLTDLQNDQRSLRVGLARERGIITSAYLCLATLSDVDHNFMYYLLHSYDLYKVFYGFGGGVRQAMKFQDLKRLPLVLPPIPEQRTIVAYLDRETARIDMLIAKQEQMIALSQEKRKAIISHAVTRGLDPKVPLKDSGVEWLGLVPEHWDTKPIKYLVSMVSGGTPDKSRLEYWGGSIPWASAKDLKVDVLTDTEDHISDKALTDEAAKLIGPELVIIVVRGMILAHTLPVTVNAVPIAINQDLKALKPIKNVKTYYLAWLLRGLSKIFLVRTDEAGHGTKTLRVEDWNDIVLPVPPLSEQLNIIQFIEEETSKIDTLIAKAQAAIDLLKEHRTSLISAAVTGKIDVRTL